MAEKIWEIAQKRMRGRPVKFEAPDDLWEAACAYFQWVADNPLEEEKAGFADGQAVYARLAKMHAMTMQGLYLHIGLTAQGFKEYEQKSEFSEICEQIRTVIFQQKFTGAAAGLLNHAIIARELGLADKSEVETKAKIEVIDRFVEDESK